MKTSDNDGDGDDDHVSSSSSSALYLGTRCELFSSIFQKGDVNCSVQYFQREKVTTTLSTNNTVLTEVLGQALPHCNNYMQLSWSVASGIGLSVASSW